MSYRRRHRWFRRLALGLAFASLAFAGTASVAYAKFDEGGSGGGSQVIPYLSHGMLTEADVQAAAAEQIRDPYLTDVFARPGEASNGPDGKLVEEWAGVEAIHDRPLRVETAQEWTVVPYLSQGMLGEAVRSESQAATQEFIPGVTDFPRVQVDVPAVRPDDARNRFAHSDVAGRPELASGGSTFETDEALTLGIGAIVLAIGLGLALGYLRRPRLAGL